MNFRILSLDGGGAWALIQVRTLIALYSETTSGHQVLGDFDLVAANSGGSLVLGGLVEDLLLGELLGYFEDEQKRKAVFSPTKSWGDWILRKLTGLGPKYCAEAKLPALQRLLPTRGNLPLPDAASGIRRAGASADIHLLIIGFDYDRNRATFFRSAQAGRSARTGAEAGCGGAWGQGDTASATLAEAIHASTNAPVNYFDAPATFPDRPDLRYWDGAITGCNNPILAAVTEAIVLGTNPTDIVALSIGTASVALLNSSKVSPKPALPYAREHSNSGLVADLRKLATAILDDPPDIATFLAYVMTGGCVGAPANEPSRIVRMSPLISPIKDANGNWAAPGSMTAGQFSYLKNLEMDAVQQRDVDAIAEYANLWLQGKALNQPIRMDGDTLTLELGHRWFQDAAASWKKIR